MNATVVFAPLVGWGLIYALAGAALVLVALALWRGLSGWWLRAARRCRRKSGRTYRIS
jgi:hypothetical protein